MIYLLIMAITSQYFTGPLPFSHNPNTDMYIKQLVNKNEITDYLQKIPKEYSVAATNNLGAHLSNRERLYVIPIGIENADIVAFLLNDRFAQPSLSAQKEMARQLENNKNYELLKEDKDFMVFKKKNIAK
jgi:hypothetical protein